jgi:hypothetical protein
MITTSIRPKLKQPLETWHPTPLDDDIMDQYDNDEPSIAKDTVPKIVDTTTDPDLSFEPSTERIAEYNSILEVPDIYLMPPSIDKMLEIHPAQDDAYMGGSLLRFSALPIKMHPDLKKPSRIKRIPSSTAVYEKELHPPLTNDITKLQELITQMLIGKRVSKRFPAGIYLGTVMLLQRGLMIIITNTGQ